MSEALHPVFQPRFETVLARNPGEAEFQQAVFEVMASLTPLVGKTPDYDRWSILQRICEPERQIILNRPGFRSVLEARMEHDEPEVLSRDARARAADAR